MMGIFASIYRALRPHHSALQGVDRQGQKETTRSLAYTIFLTFGQLVLNVVVVLIDRSIGRRKCPAIERRGVPETFAALFGWAKAPRMCQCPSLADLVREKFASYMSRPLWRLGSYAVQVKMAKTTSVFTWFAGHRRESSRPLPIPSDQQPLWRSDVGWFVLWALLAISLIIAMVKFDSRFGRYLRPQNAPRIRFTRSAAGEAGIEGTPAFEIDSAVQRFIRRHATNLVFDNLKAMAGKGRLGCITGIGGMKVDLTDTTVRVTCSRGSQDALVVGAEVRGVHCSVDVFAPKLMGKLAVTTQAAATKLTFAVRRRDIDGPSRGQEAILIPDGCAIDFGKLVVNRSRSSPTSPAPQHGDNVLQAAAKNTAILFGSLMQLSKDAIACASCPMIQWLSPCLIEGKVLCNCRRHARLIQAFHEDFPERSEKVGAVGNVLPLLLEEAGVSIDDLSVASSDDISAFRRTGSPPKTCPLPAATTSMRSADHRLRSGRSPSVVLGSGELAGGVH